MPNFAKWCILYFKKYDFKLYKIFGLPNQDIFRVWKITTFRNEF